MVASQLRTTAVTDARLVAAMSEVAREDYLPAAHAALAYRDRPVPLGGGREQNAPLATARLLNAADIRPTDRVLLIGGASGYTAALLSRLAASVVSVESDPGLQRPSNGNVETVENVLAEGHPAGAPYDVIVVDGAVEQLPDALVAQVRVGGRIVSGIVERGVVRLAAGTRTAGGFALTPFADIDCVILPGFARPRSFSFPG
jgi:protein-L-isoaspartate(D-aspartate) O-methyltransferase